MDLYGTSGYQGQTLQFVRTDNFSFITGNGICVVDVAKGPREVLWRPDVGISSISSHLESNRFIMVPQGLGFDAEVVDLTEFFDSQSSSTPATASDTKKHKLILKNPTDAKIYDVSFSRNGDRIYGLSGDLDPKVICWNGSTGDLLFTTNISTSFKKCVVNPIDSNRVCLYGDNGIEIGTISEIMGVYSMRLEKISISDKTNEPLSNNVGPQLVVENPTLLDEGEITTESLPQKAAISFAVWTGMSQLFVGSTQGNIFDVDPISLSSRLVSKTFMSKKGFGQNTVPTCAVITLTTLIVGTSNGILHWFSLDDITEYLTSQAYAIASGSKGKELCSPVQVASLEGCVVSITMNPSFDTVYVGSSNGTISIFPVKTVDLKTNGEEDENRDATRQMANDEIIDLPDLTPSQVMRFQSGAILCSQSIALAVPGGGRFSSYFVTGSYLGQITFWRQPSVETEPMTVGMHEVRRSIPRNFEAVTTIFISDESDSTTRRAGQRTSSGAPSSRAICSLEVYPSSQSTFLLIGTADGWLEFLEISASESEEEEFNASNEEDDEGGALKLSVAKISRRHHIFNSSLSLLSLSPIIHTSLPNVASKRYLAVGSHFDSFIYLLSISKGTFFEVVAYFSLGENEFPSTLVWKNATLWVGCNSGKLFSFPSKNLNDTSASRLTVTESGDSIDPNPAISLVEEIHLLEPWMCGLSTISGGLLMKSGHMVLNSEDSVFMTQINLPDDASTFPNINTAKCCLEHTDFVVCCASCPNDRYWASGCSDGSLFVWMLEKSDSGFASWKLANKIHLHSSAILSLSFSRDSSFLLSSAADGSMFLLSVDKPIKIRIEKSADLDSNISRYSNSRLKKSSQDKEDSIWLDERKIVVKELTVKQNEPIAAQINNSIEDIVLRLQSMLERNAARNDLERMDRSEFVIDIMGRDNAFTENQVLAAQLKNSYTERNLWNELNAARIRQHCWDSMDSNSSQLLPFFIESSSENPSINSPLSSFSVQKLTDNEIALMEKVKRMRSIEIRSQKVHEYGTIKRISNGNVRVSWITNSKGNPQDIAWINNDGDRWPSNEIIDILSRRESTDISDKIEEGQPSDTLENSVDEDDEQSITSDVRCDIDETNILHLLYAPPSVRTQIQKRSQIILLKEVVRMIRSKFNEHFERLRREKEDILASVESRNVRIKIILSELQTNEDILEPTLGDTELCKSAIEVRDDDIVNRPYENEAVRLARKEEEERRKREAEGDKEDVKGRALDEMMHGTLDVKRDVFAEASALHRPAWMDEIPFNEMTESQQKEAEAFESRFKALQEEQAKYRKSLEQELKKLKGEIVDVCKTFDEKLASLTKLKISSQREILGQELYIARISLNMAKRDQAWNALKRTEKSISETRIKRNETRIIIESFTAQVDEVRNKLSNVQEEERNLDKTFKRDLQTLCNNTFDQDALKVFTILFRQRSYPDMEDENLDVDGDESEVIGNQQSKRGSNRTSNKNRKSARRMSKAGSSAGKVVKMKASKGMSSGGGGKELGPMQRAAQALINTDKVLTFELDPYCRAIALQEKAKKVLESQIPSISPLSLEADCPDGFNVDQFTWSQLQELRTNRIKKEIEGKRLTAEYAEIKNKLDLLCNDDAVLVTCLNTLRIAREEILIYLKELESSVEAIICLRQGQDEVDKDALVTNYNDAMLLPVDVVYKFNSRIKELGRDKISVLTRIKEFRRKINLIDWEANHLGLESKHFEEYFTDLQLLRVTRELQHVIREGSDADQAKDRLDKVAARKEFLQNEAETRILKLKRNNDAMRRQVIERRQEVFSLEERIRELTAQVVARKNVKQSRDDARGKTGDAVNVAAKKMKKVMARRHLVDTARAQAEEIDFLRQELDRMRQRCFPSFVRKRISQNPDER